MLEAIPLLTTQRDRFLSFVQRRVRDRATAEDILQAAYTRAIGHAGTLKASDSAEAWFFRILRNGIIDHHRHRAVEDRTLMPTPELEPAAPESAATRLCRCMNHAIEEIRPAYREILEEVDLNETSLQGFAQQAGITAGTAAVRAHRARRALHQKLVHRCGSCAEHAGCLDCTCRSSSSSPSH